MSIWCISSASYLICAAWWVSRQASQGEPQHPQTQTQISPYAVHSPPSPRPLGLPRPPGCPPVAPRFQLQQSYARAGGTGPCLRTSVRRERELQVAWRTPGTRRGVIRSAFMTGGRSQRKDGSLLLILFPLHTSEVNGICNYSISTNRPW